MDTNRIKKFATEARNILKKGIAVKITSLGFDAKGHVQEQHKPQLMQGGSLWNGQLQTEGFYHRWMALYNRVEQKGIKEVYEEAAYTWFNRLMAIRILQKNGLCEGVMDYADEARTPRIVNEARTGNIPQMSEESRRHLMDLLDDDTKVTEQFALLITTWCQQNPILSACFGGMADYTELLLPANILAEGGLVDMINHTEFITDEEYQSPELIGWLYQFYISERKDEVFAKKGKFEADEIPAATQIFTPNWIVKYMVQNTVGRIYLDNNPWTADEFKPKWKYLVEPSTPTPQENIYKYNELTDLKVADLACGSGHILNECFDLLYDLYISEGYSRREAIENIFQKNLTGVDLDTRAQQMATFALLLKASQKDSNFADAHVLPNVLNMPKCDRYTWRELSGHFNSRYGLHCPASSATELEDAFTLMEDADSLGSIMIFNLSETTKLYIHQCIEQYESDVLADKGFRPFIKGMKVMETLTTKYSTLVMNPPYMGNGNMNAILSKYVKDEYEEGKADLCTAFMVMQANNTAKGGYYANIIPPSWMFLSTFENLRRSIIEKQTIQSLLHLSRGVFGADFGSVSCVIQNKKTDNASGIYFRLIERTFQEFDQKHLQLLFEQTLANHDFKYCFSDYTKDVTDIVYSEKGAKIYYPRIFQNNFEKIPGCPIGYWLSKNMLNHFVVTKQMGNYFDVKSGLSTGDNSVFVRFWHEINSHKMFIKTVNDKYARNGYKWFPYSKGGGVKKWYGNKELVVNYENDAYAMKQLGLAVFRNPTYYFREGLTWSGMSSSYVSYRYLEAGGIFDSNKGPMIFTKSIRPSLEYALGLLNTKVSNLYTQLLNPTVSTQIGDVIQIPVDYVESKAFEIENLAINNIKISKFDWDAHETSWDFQENELTFLSKREGVSKKLAEIVEQYKEVWTERFMQLHANEEELNRQFIEIYGLQDELTPDVPLDEITILQQGEVKIEDNQIKWNNDVIVKQLISYAIAVWMGRYRLDKPGLHIAHPEPTDEELEAYSYGNETVYIDDDGIIPVLPTGCPFDDNLPNRIADFIRIAFGEEHLTENLNYMEKQLGMSIEQYVLKDFWKDHKKMYQNRPIYWLFSSKKGAFKCITYMHRMDAYTAERVRSKYLLPYIEMLSNKVNDLTNRAASLTTVERRQLDNYKKTLEECNEYHDRLQVLAEDTERTTFDLDDGVVVNYAKYGDVLAKIK